MGFRYWTHKTPLMRRVIEEYESDLTGKGLGDAPFLHIGYHHDLDSVCSMCGRQIKDNYYFTSIFDADLQYRSGHLRTPNQFSVGSKCVCNLLGLTKKPRYVCSYVLVNRRKNCRLCGGNIVFSDERPYPLNDLGFGYADGADKHNCSEYKKFRREKWKLA